MQEDWWNNNAGLCHYSSFLSWKETRLMTEDKVKTQLLVAVAPMFSTEIQKLLLHAQLYVSNVFSLIYCLSLLIFVFLFLTSQAKKWTMTLQN